MLSGRCNLSCAYCYLDRSRGTTMRWETLASALKVAIGSGAERVGVEFTGGEPLLEVDLIRRAVDFVAHHGPAGTAVSFSVTTNGTLLSPEVLALLFAHDFAVRVSFDGVAAAQGQRGRETFPTLDRLLDRLHLEFPVQLSESVTVAVTLVAATIPHMAESVRYLVGKGVGKIALGPRLTWDPDWREAFRDELGRQVGEIVEFSAEHWRRTGAVPVGFLARPPLRDRTASVGKMLCGAFDGSMICVEPDGRVSACPLFAGPPEMTSPLARSVARRTALGMISDGGLAQRLATLRRRASALRVLTNGPAKRSSYGSCVGCRFLADCDVCPASICHIPGNRDPDLVPDFICAFNQITLGARERFDELTGGATSAAWYEEVRKALRQVGEAIKRSGGPGSRPPRVRPESRRSIRD